MEELIPNDVSDFTVETEAFSLSCITKAPKEELPPVLIENFLHKGHCMLLFGPPKAGKSFLALMLAVAIITGGEWLGNNKCLQGNVLIIEFENGSAMTRERIRKIMEENNLDEKYLSRLCIVTFKKHADINDIVNGLIEKVPPSTFAAIIIDPLYKLLSGCESQAEAIDPVLLKINELSKALKSSVILCHHTKKEGQGYQNLIDRICGSGLISRDMQTLVGITSVKKNGNCKKERIETEFRFFPPQPPFYINLSGSLCSVEMNKDSNEFDTASTSAKASKDAPSEKTQDLIRFYNFLNNMNGTVKISQLEELMGASKNTIKAYIDDTPGFARDKKGIVTYTESRKE